MAKWPILSGAPITEAILDIQVDLPDTVTLDDLKRIQGIAGDSFVEAEQRLVISGTAEIDPSQKGHSFSSSSKIDGYRFRSPIDGKVVQSRLDGFAFNKLKPYKSWAAFSSEAKGLWEAYCEIAGPTLIKGISLRYINKVDLDLPIDLAEWFSTCPTLGDGIPLSIQHFLMRVEVADDSIHSQAIITQTAQRLTDESAAIILDIDVKKTLKEKLPFKRLWPDFEKLRNFKNLLFFNSITKKTKEFLR